MRQDEAISLLSTIASISNWSGGGTLASITVRNLDDEVKRKLRIRAAEHGCSMEAEVREILTQAVYDVPKPRKGLDTRIHERFNAIGGIDLELPERGPMREPPQYKSELVRRIRMIVDPVGGIDLELPKRSSGNRELPKFE